MKVRRLYDIGLILSCDPIFYSIIFIVDLNGNVARLESMESPTQIIDSAKTEPSMSSDRKRKSDDSVDLCGGPINKIKSSDVAIPIHYKND